MEFEGFFRFKIGEIVQLKAAAMFKGSLVPQALQIVERNLQECYGGHQARYLVRAVVPDPKSGLIGFHPDLYSLTDPEVEEYVVRFEARVTTD